MKEASAPTLYPGLPTAENFRVQRIVELQQQLEVEKETRMSLRKKYQRVINTVDWIDAALATASMGMGASGVGLLSTIVAAPVVLGLEIAALACGLAGLGGKFISRKLQVKAQKHDQIRLLAEAKINTISDHVSKALRDGQISEEEFKLILDECDKYRQMKTQIRVGALKNSCAVVLDEEAKNALIAQGREEARAAILKNVAGNFQ